MSEPDLSDRVSALELLLKEERDAHASTIAQLNRMTSRVGGLQHGLNSVREARDILKVEKLALMAALDSRGNAEMIDAVVTAGSSFYIALQRVCAA